MPGEFYQGNYDFTVGMGFEIVRAFQLLSQKPMVVYLAINCQRKGTIIVDQRLGTRVFESSVSHLGWDMDIPANPNNTQTLMGQDYKSISLLSNACTA